VQSLLKNDTQVYKQFAEEAVLAGGALPISRWSDHWARRRSRRLKTGAPV